MRFKNILFPKRCRYCGSVISLNKESCPDCEAAARLVPSEYCTYCGCEKELCVCKQHKMHYDSVNAAFYYTDSIKKLIHRMKFDDGCELCEFMADMMYQRYKTLSSSFDMICYVPQTEAELQERGFNQSKLLAELLSIKCRLPVVPALTKIYETEHQRSLRALERSGNVFGVFDIADREAIKDKSILLVDDIKTGGATLNECAKMLKIYDAGTVTALVFAVGITDN